MSSFDRAHVTSYRCSIATMGLSRTVSEINGDFGQKSQIFPTPVYFAPHWRGSPWNWVSAPGSKTRLMGLPGGERSLTISSAVRIYLSLTKPVSWAYTHDRDLWVASRPVLRVTRDVMPHTIRAEFGCPGSSKSLLAVCGRVKTSRQDTWHLTSHVCDVIGRQRWPWERRLFKRLWLAVVAKWVVERTCVLVALQIVW